MHFEEVDGRVQQQYESKLKEALQEMREDNEYSIRTTREETESVFMSKVNTPLTYYN